MSQYKVADIVFPLNAREGYEEGDVAAHRAAGAMGDRFDSPTIIAVTDALRYLVMRGGQMQIGAVREWVGLDGTPASKDEPGEYRTLGLTIFYETRDAKIHRQKPMTEIQGVPVSDFEAPPLAVDYTTLEPEMGADDAGLEQELEPQAEPALSD